MKKGILKRSFVLLLTVLILALYVIPSTTSVSAQKKNKGKAKFMMIALMEEPLTKNQKEVLETAGWTVQGKRVFKTRNFVDGEIQVNEKKTLIDSDGSFFVENNPEEIEVSINDEKMKVKKDKNGEYNFVFPISWNHFYDVMDHHDQEAKQQANSTLQQDTPNSHILKTNNIKTNVATSLGLSNSSSNYTQAGYGDKYYKGDSVHCNRFNGPWSDDIHYPKSDWRAIRNFAQSDCDDALAIRCLKDYTSETWCNGTGGAAACSGKIGHSKKYHAH